MKPWLLFPGGLLALTVGVVSQPSPPKPTDTIAFETRCGWFSNPTPANAWLYDHAGEWTIGGQGGHLAEGDWPAFKSTEWVETNGHYGYGCACFQLTVDKQTHKVLESKALMRGP